MLCHYSQILYKMAIGGKWGGEVRTMVSQTCMLLFVRNQCMNVPSGGIICGYCRFFCASLSCSASGAPGYWRGFLRILEGCEGGLNFVGFSSTLILLEGPVEAWRRVVAARRRWNRGSRRYRWPLGRRKRGIVFVAIARLCLRKRFARILFKFSEGLRSFRQMKLRAPHVSHVILLIYLSIS